MLQVTVKEIQTAYNLLKVISDYANIGETELSVANKIGNIFPLVNRMQNQATLRQNKLLAKYCKEIKKQPKHMDGVAVVNGKIYKIENEKLFKAEMDKIDNYVIEFSNFTPFTIEELKDLKVVNLPKEGEKPQKPRGLSQWEVKTLGKFLENNEPEPLDAAEEFEKMFNENNSNEKG